MFKPPKRVEHKIEKLNLIPIMDAVFIFIFFLLFSAQFIKIYEISSDAPVISEIPPEEKLKKEPLNAIVKVNNQGITVTTGVDSKIYRQIDLIAGEYDFKELKKIALELKNSKPDEEYIIISPIETINYNNIVKAMDAVQRLPKGSKDIEINGKRFSKIFNQVVLEPNL